MKKKLLILIGWLMLAGSVQANDLLPVADFDPEPDRSWFYHAENIVFSSDSYDPDGGGITGYWWYIKIGGATYWTYKYGGTSATEYAACFELDQTGTTSNGCIGLGSATTVSIWLKVRDNEYNYSNHQVTYTIKEHKGRKYFVKDHLGSVRTTVNRDGNVLGYDDYYPFGLAMTGRSSNSANPNDDYKYIGEELDDEAGLNLMNLNARTYDPITARFLQIDPLFDHPAQMGLSPYNYAWNNPMNLSDPTGECPLCIAIAGAVWVGVEIGLAAYDIYDVVTTLSDENATTTQKVVSVSGATAGMLLPGGGYSATDDIVEGAVKYGDEIVEAAGDVTVYLSKNADDAVQYVGITNDLARRGATHLREKGIQIDELVSGLTRDDARAVEQALIEIHGLGKDGGTLLNKINSIAESNPKYSEALERGYELLKSIGYE